MDGYKIKEIETVFKLKCNKINRHLFKIDNNLN